MPDALNAEADAALPFQPTQREITTVYIGLMIVMALAAIDQSIVATALPKILADLGGLAHLSWVVTAYVLAATSTIALYGKLSDQYGRKALLYVAVGVFLAGSILCGFARSMPQLILFRAIQGLGAGGLQPLSQIIIADLVPPRQRGRYQGWIGAVFALASVSGPLVGGLITEGLSWHWIFYVNIPVGVVAVAIIEVALRLPKPTVRGRIDFAGAALLAIASTAFMLVMSLGGVTLGWRSPALLGIAALAVAATLLFLLVESNAAEPLIPLRLFRGRIFVLGALVYSLASMGLMGATVFFPLFFQSVLGVGAARSGLLTGPLMIAFVISTRVSGGVLVRTGRYKPVQLAGLVTAAVSFAALAFATDAALPIWLIEIPITCLGLGIGCVFPTVVVAVQNAASGSEMGVTTATLVFLRSLGGATGVAGAGAIFAAWIGGASAEAAAPGGGAILATGRLLTLYRGGLATDFAAGAAITALAVVFLLFLPEVPLKAKAG